MAISINNNVDYGIKQKIESEVNINKIIIPD